MRALVRNSAIQVVLSALCLVHVGSQAQVVTDGSLGNRTTISGPTFALPNTLGVQRGGNLFHSFSTFNIRTGETALFSGPAGILNILARITGGTRSDINGRVRSTIAGANLFLLNPSGIVFGPSATLDVNGSFYASSAAYVRLADGVRFDTNASQGVVLTSASPEAFGFNGPTGNITVTGSTLAVPSGRQLGLFGGDITIDKGTRAATLQALGGRIYLASVASPGEVRFADARLDTSAFAQLGNVVVRDGALVSVNESSLRTGSGTIFVRSGNFTLDQSSVESRTRFASGGGIDIAARERTDILAGNVIAVTTGAGAAGTINLAGRNILINGASLVDTSCDPGCSTGNGGPLNISASGSLAIEGASPTNPTFVVSNSFGRGNTGAISIVAGSLNIAGNAFVQAATLGAGNSSGITLNTGSITLSGGAQIDAGTRAAGAGGNINITNSGAIRIEGTRIDPAQPGVSLPSGVFVNTSGSGNAGNLTISTRTLEILAGGEVSSTSRRFATGSGGRITINALERIVVTGVDASGKSSGIVANTFGKGNAGAIDLTADAIEIRDRGRVQVQSEGDGAANTIRIRARNLTMSGGGQISSDARGRGDGGSIDVDLTDKAVISGIETGIFAKSYGPAKGGSIKVHADQVMLDERSGIFASTDGTGDGGTVSIAVDTLLRVSNGARVAAESSDRGLAGNISITSNKDIELDKGRITTSAVTSDGGNILLIAGNHIFVTGGSVETAVGKGRGDGGNIRMQQPLLILRGAVVSANAFGGAGGNIRISADNFFQSGDSRVTASSQLGIDGTVVLDSPAIDPSGELIAPPASYLNVAAILASRCGPRLAGKASSLVVNDIGLPANTSTQLQLPLQQASFRLQNLGYLGCTSEQKRNLLRASY